LPPAPAPMAEPLPPPPPPAPMVISCNKGPFILFFDWDRSDVMAEGASILDSAIQAYGNCGSAGIMLAGYTDASGSATYNVGLAQRRDAAVQSYLTSHGLASANISAKAFGEANQRVPTADGVRELQNRRVEITYGPGSGY
jgi:OOP family OmpA-OmpF porin